MAQKITVPTVVTEDAKKSVRNLLLAHELGSSVVITEEQLGSALFLAREEARRWRESNAKAVARNQFTKTVLAASKDPEKLAKLRELGINV